MRPNRNRECAAPEPIRSLAGRKAGVDGDAHASQQGPAKAMPLSQPASLTGSARWPGIGRST